VTSVDFSPTAIAGPHEHLGRVSAPYAVVVLSTEFYDELVAHAVPIDLRALKALKALICTAFEAPGRLPAQAVTEPRPSNSPFEAADPAWRI
jgi:hypothetical protein